MPLSKEGLVRLIETSPDIVVATDASGRVAFYSEGARENLGYTRDEVLGIDVVRLYPSRGEAQRVMAAMRDPEQGGPGRIVNFRTTFVAKDGRRLPVSISGVILYGPDGEEQGTIGFAKDLRDIIRKDKLAVLGEVAVGLSHRINNPLEALVNQIELLGRCFEGHEGADEQRERLRAMRQEVERIETIMRRLSGIAGEEEEYASTDYVRGSQMLDLSTPAESPKRSLVGQRVLVVDDDASVRQTVSDILRAEGCLVECASDGRQALERVLTGNYDIVLSDVVMPGIDGYELYQEVRRCCPATQVALMTAYYYDRDHIIQRSRLEGLEGVLFKKPIKPERLRATLEKLVTPPPPTPS